MKNLVNYAMKYAEKGLYVLPIIDKQPLIKFADEPAMTVSEIEQFWQTHPYAQIAVRTVDFFVIDIDTEDAHGKNGYQSIETVKELLPPTLSQRTPSGGEQMFYMKPSHGTVSQNIGWLDGVDVKAHINNYVMIAPSSRNGKQYEWLNHDPIVTPSQELIRLINKRKPAEYSRTNYDLATGKTATSDLFEKIINGLGETGGRNNALASFIGGLLFRGVSVDTAYKLAQQANENTEKSLNEKEFDRTFNSMAKKEIRRRELADGSSRQVERNATEK